MDLKYIQQHLNECSLVEILQNTAYMKTYLYHSGISTYLYKHYTFPISQRSFTREIRAIRSLSNTNTVLPLLDFQESASSGAALFDFTGFHFLLSQVQENRPLDLPVLFVNLLKSLSKLHQENFIHRNLSLHCIYVADDLSVRLGGLESAITQDQLDESYGVQASEDIEASIDIENRPPELLDLVPGVPITSQIDMWSLGCVIFQLIYRKKPFDCLEKQIRGEIKENAQGVWRIVFKRLFNANPRLRGDCKELLVVMASTNSEEEQKQKKTMLSGFFGKSTESWVKSLTKNKDSSIKTGVFKKLIQKANKKPEKINKFYKSLQKSHIIKPKVCIKCLLLLHRYINFGPPAVIIQPIQTFLTYASSLWANLKNKELQKLTSTTYRHLILDYITILDKSYTLHKQLPGNWEHLEIFNLSLLKTLLDYYHSLTSLALYLSTLSDLENIYKDIIVTIIEEQKKINVSILPCIKEANASFLRTEYEVYHEKHLEVLHYFYNKFPLVDLQTWKAPTDNIYKQRRSRILPLNNPVKQAIDFLDVSAENRSVEELENEEPCKISLQELSFEEVVGIGGSCTVYRGQ